MPRKVNDLTGNRYGRLVVIKRDKDYISPHGATTPRWLCKCDCGNIVAVNRSNLLSGHTSSCGCFRHDLRIEKGKWKGHSRDLLHFVWKSMLRRCNNPEDKNYVRYGGRGIRVCKEWEADYFVFRKWALDNGYQERTNLSIDRIDPDGNYEPQNCRWATTKIQNNNKRNTDNIHYKGETHPLAEWAKILGIKYKTLRGRLYAYGWTVEEAFLTNSKRTIKGTDEQ